MVEIRNGWLVEGDLMIRIDAIEGIKNGCQVYISGGIRYVLSEDAVDLITGYLEVN